MPPIPFPQFLNRFGIKLLAVSTPDIVPGALIERNKKGFFRYGHLQQVLGGDDKSWRCELKPANFIYGTVRRTLSLKARASLNEFGVNIGGGLRRAKSVDFFLQNVQAKILVKYDKMELIPELFEYREKNPTKWRRYLNDKWVAHYTYYATEVRFSFETDRGVDLRADIADEISVVGGGSIEWKTTGSFIITNTDDVPFGFSGWKL